MSQVRSVYYVFSLSLGDGSVKESNSILLCRKSINILVDFDRGFRQIGAGTPWT
jgi:hypothetical protein